MSTELPTNITEEMLETLSNNSGETLSGLMSIDGDATTFRPTTKHAINEGHHQVRPRIGGLVNGKERIRRASSDLPRKLAEGDEKLRA